MVKVCNITGGAGPRSYAHMYFWATFENKANLP